MSPAHLPRTQIRSSAARSLLTAAVVCLAVPTALLAAGCGDDSSGTQETVTTSAETAEAPSTTEEPPAMSAAELGDAVSATWVEAMQELNALLADTPDAATVRPQVEELKETYIQQFVELGRQKEAMDAAQQAEVNARVASTFRDASEEEWFATYGEIYAFYAGSDVEFANLLSSFNVLTQYADFELLREQAPDEAARLGIE